jgi:GNAT superfamily N-acetyltransferase
MATVQRVIERVRRSVHSSAEWIELVRDLRSPIIMARVPKRFRMRRGSSEDLKRISALEGYVKDPCFLKSSLKKGDWCLIFAKGDSIAAFNWVTFRNYPLNSWHTLRLPPGYAYLAYIFVQPEYRNQKVGTRLLGCTLTQLKEQGYRGLISGMYSDWIISLRMHYTQGFKLYRTFKEQRILNCMLLPPKRQFYLDIGKGAI